MPSSNVIQFSTSSLANSIKKGNAILGISSVEYGPTSTTGFWNGITPPSGGYTIYVSRSAPGPNIYTPSSNNELITYSSKIANIPFTSTSGALAWFATQSNSIVVNKNYPDIVTDGLSLLLDASFTPSYPTTNSVWYDISGNNKNGSLINGTTFNSNGWVDFDGVDDYINLSSVLTLSGSFTWTINCKSNLMSSTQNRQVYLGGSSTWFEQSDNDTFFIVNSPVLNLELPTGLLPQSRFYNVTLTRKADNTFDFYYNGVKQILRSGGTTPISASFILNRIGSTGFNARFWNGSMSNIIIYNKLLNDNEILQNYYQAPIITNGLVFAVDASNLVSYENGSTTTYSLTGSFSGSLVNGTGYLPFYGGAWDLDGADDYINIPYSGSTSGSFTFNIIMKSDTMDSNNSNRQTLFGLSQNGNAAYRQFDVEIWGNTGRGFRGNGGSTENVDFFPYSWTLGVDAKDVNIYTIILNSTSQTIYVNGQLRNTINQAYTASFNSITLGTRLVGNLWNGQCYYFSIYNRPLSASEIAQNFNAQRQRFGI